MFPRKIPPPKTPHISSMARQPTAKNESHFTLSLLTVPECRRFLHFQCIQTVSAVVVVVVGGGRRGCTTSTHFRPTPCPAAYRTAAAEFFHAQHTMHVVVIPAKMCEKNPHARYAPIRWPQANTTTRRVRKLSVAFRRRDVGACMHAPLVRVILAAARRRAWNTHARDAC